MGLRCSSRSTIALAALALAASSTATAPLHGQAGWLERAREVAQSTGLGVSVTRAAAEARLLDATRISLEDGGLPTLAVGPLTLGISAVDVRSGVAVRLHGYLLNPATQPVTIPVPDPALFVLVDGQGRRLARLAGPDVRGLPSGAGEITVPALERVVFTLLYGELAPNAQRGTLKVGELGLIPGIPLDRSTGSPATQPSPGGQNVWSAPSAPPSPPTPEPGGAGTP